MKGSSIATEPDADVLSEGNAIQAGFHPHNTP
jgi:hypothetical protein